MDHSSSVQNITEAKNNNTPKTTLKKDELIAGYEKEKQSLNEELNKKISKLNELKERHQLLKNENKKLSEIKTLISSQNNEDLISTIRMYQKKAKDFDKIKTEEEERSNNLLSQWKLQILKKDNLTKSLNEEKSKTKLLVRCYEEIFDKQREYYSELLNEYDSLVIEYIQQLEIMLNGMNYT
ncbi:hypothetical protein FQR65_LT02125 [Abscondita terminalis]|nr:hypothetical protein FQR65_LT02125 [Abscondita terminalis]